MQDHVNLVLYIIDNSVGDKSIVVPDSTPDTPGVIIDNLRPGTNYTIRSIAIADTLNSEFAGLNVVTGWFYNKYR